MRWAVFLGFLFAVWKKAHSESMTGPAKTATRAPLGTSPTNVAGVEEVPILHCFEKLPAALMGKHRDLAIPEMPIA